MDLMLLLNALAKGGLGAVYKATNNMYKKNQ